ncbi:MAG: putative sugar transporter substrate-binding protein [Propionibacteriaceae bacterium]|jgi:ribose transport system substrate-binding protein|nr:putative sugar transporter substrate-binding protein [Propionibacteriaceae bacterium]
MTSVQSDDLVEPNRRQGFLDGLKEGGIPYEIKGEQSGDYQQDKDQVAAETCSPPTPTST